MPYEVCYRALWSISVVEGFEATCHTHTHATLRRAPAPLQPLTAARARRAKRFQISPRGQLSGGPTRLVVCHT